MEATLRSWVGDRYVDLVDVLRLVGENAWSWRLEDFEGTSVPGRGLNVLELDERLRRGEFMIFEWQDLVSFARQLNQMTEGRVVALGNGDTEPRLVLTCVEARSGP